MAFVSAPMPRLERGSRLFVAGTMNCQQMETVFLKIEIAGEIFVMCFDRACDDSASSDPLSSDDELVVVDIEPGAHGRVQLHLRLAGSSLTAAPVKLNIVYTNKYLRS